MIKNRRFLLPLAVICLALSVLFERLGAETIPNTDFVQGLLLGITLGMSVVALIMEAVSRQYE